MRNIRNAESIKDTVDMCSVPVTTSEPFEGPDGVVAVGTKVRHVLQAVHAERDQATPVHTTAINSKIVRSE